jgi:coenzyme F420-reducing hydrogenase delta subunit
MPLELNGRSVASWVESHVKELDEKSKLRFALRHIIGNKKELVKRWNATRETGVNELSIEISEAARVDALTTGAGEQRYEVIALVDGENVGRFGFRAAVDSENEDGLDGIFNGRYALDECAVDLVKQAQGHVDGLVRALGTLVIGTERGRVAEIERITNRSILLENKIDEMRTEFEKAKDNDLERQLKKDKFEKDQRRLDEVFATARVMLPFVVNSFAKKQLVPTGDNSVLKEALRPVMTEMTMDQISKLQEILSPPQMVALLELWRMLNEGKSGEEGNGKSNGATSS